MDDAETHDVMMNIPVWMMTSETRVCCALGAMRRKKRDARARFCMTRVFNDDDFVCGRGWGLRCCVRKRQYEIHHIPNLVMIIMIIICFRVKYFKF